MASTASTMTSTVTMTAEDKWGGGNEPMRASYGKLMMWFFLLSDALTFSGLLLAYGTLRMSNDAWPLPDHVFSSFPGVEYTHQQRTHDPHDQPLRPTHRKRRLPRRRWPPH